MTRRQMYIKMVLSSLVRRKARMFVALLAVAIGATIMSGLFTIYYDIPRQLGKEFRSYGANFVILPSGDSKISNNEFEKIKELLPQNKVVGLAPYRYETTKINQQPYILAGTDLKQAKNNSPFWYVEGKWLDEDSNTDVMIGREIANKLNLKIGDTFKVEGPKAGTKVITSKQSDSAEESKNKNLAGTFYAKKLKVQAIITTGGREESFIFLPIKLLNDILEDETNIDGIEASIEGDSEFLNNLAEKLNDVSGITARPVKRVTQSQDTVLGKLQALVLLVNLVVLILTMISVSTTMMAVVAERRKEIGLKKALGAPNEEIKKEFLGEGLALGFIGGLLGVGLGFVFAQEVSLSVFGRAIHFQWMFAPITVIISMLITALACLYPVRQTVEIDPAIVLRGE